MNTIKNCFIVLLLFVLQFPSNYVFTQTDYRSKSKHSITAGINSDGFFGLECGYKYKSKVIINNNELYWGSHFQFPILINIKEGNIQDWEFRLSATSNVLHPSNYNINVGLSLYSIRHKQILGDFFTIGNNVRVTPRYMFKYKGYLGIQLELQNSIATHIFPSDYVASTYQELYDKNNKLICNSPKKGWYKSTGTSYKTGIEFFTPVSKKTGLYFDLGLQYFNSKYIHYFDNMAAGFVPLYMNISITHFL